MLRRTALFIGGSLFLWSALLPSMAFAQADVDPSRLERYYTESIRSERNTKTYEPIIAAERERIRGLLQEWINELVQPAKDPGLEPTKVIDRQREVVADLRGRLNESTVDLNLLTEEERIYTGETPTGAGSGRYMMTKSYPELLARKVVLEEEVSLLSSALEGQETKLQKLLLEERSKNIALFLAILWYIAVIFVIISLESFLRTQVILRLPHRALRYAIAKVFTLVVYLSLLFWLAQKFFAENPGFTTIFAVVGAALIFMFQDIIKSFLGWLTYKGSFTLGQRIQIGGYTGDVLDISILYTTLLASRPPAMEDVSQAGKVVRLPNALLLTSPLINLSSTSDFENVEIPVYLADPKQAERAKVLLEEILEQEVSAFTETARRQMDRRMRGFYFSQVSPSLRVYMESTDRREIVFLLCFPAPIGQRRLVVTKILERILKKFEEEGVGWAKPA